MTRREEIQKLIDEEMGIDNYGSCDFQVGVIYGVRYADKTMIEKATQWLKNTLYEVATGLTNRPDVVSIESTTMDDFINNFRKAMEE